MKNRKRTVNKKYIIFIKIMIISWNILNLIIQTNQINEINLNLNIINIQYNKLDNRDKN